MECVHWWGPHTHWFWIMPCLFMILMFALASRAFWRAGARRRSSGDRTDWWPCGWWGPGRGRSAHGYAETPWGILDQRYARGEITREQYERMRSDIETSRSRATQTNEQRASADTED